MTVSITQLHNEDRLAGTLANLNRGPAAPKLRIYSAPRPANASAAVGAAVMLAEFTLDDPPGAVAANELVLTPVDDALVLVDGTAVWARAVNGDGDTSFDCDCSDNAGSGEIKLMTVSLIAGATVRLSTAKFT